MCITPPFNIWPADSFHYSHSFLGNEFDKFTMIENMIDLKIDVESLMHSREIDLKSL